MSSLGNAIRDNQQRPCPDGDLLSKTSEEPKPNHTLDCIGLFCPEPVFQTRQALDKIPKGEILEVWVDDPAAEADLTSLAKRLHTKILKAEKKETGIRFLLQKG